MGDPAGIGPEVIVKAFQDGEVSRFCQGVVIGDAALLRATASQFSPALQIRAIRDLAEARFEEGRLDVIDLQNVPENLAKGQAVAAAGKAAMEYVRMATDLALQGQVEAITTAPINKKAIHLAGYDYPGHTEFLAEYTGTRDFALMMVGRNLRVVLATNHVPLQKVSALIDKDHIAGIIRLTHRWLCRFVTESPKIAVLGLNPHCGEDGIFGEEETRTILPAVRQTQSEGIRVTGPCPADSFFSEARNGAYDAVIAMYHDQGLIPVKMESMGHAVNLTMGLPIIRTSVDHGTAYDIVGKGIASSASLVEALKSAAYLSKPALAAK